MDRFIFHNNRLYITDKMKRFLIILIMGMVSLIVPAQNNQKIIDHINQVAHSLKSMQADFIQTKTMKMLGDKMVSNGKMYYQQSDKLHWEYTIPYTYTFILNGDKVLLKKGTRKDVIDVNKNKVFKEIARIMMSSMVGTCLTEKKDFSVSVVETDQTYTATLIPQKKEMKQMYTKIVLTFTKKTSMISRVVMYEKNGDNTEIVLKNVVTNKTINPSYFAI